MREIKFRSFSKSWNCMRTSTDDWWIGLEISTGKKVCIINGKIEDAPADIVFMQYTGLKDKNGKEIYEGDILQGTGVFGVIRKWEAVSLEYFHHWEETEDLINKHGDIEVIGNIYENSELLE